MINVTTVDRDDFGSRGVCPIDDTDFEDMNATPSQKKSLVELIYQKCDEKEREIFLSSLESMSRNDVEDLKYSLLSNSWR